MSLSKNDVRIPAVDLLRGLAVLAVVLTHVSQKIAPEGDFLKGYLPKFLQTAFFKSGYYGVIVFFVISGFLITMTSLRRWGQLQNVQKNKFYLFRFARIAPNLIGLILVLSLCHLFGMSGFIIDTTRTGLGEAVFAASTFHINWLAAFSGGLALPWTILWSLAVEEVFYLFFPITCLLPKRGFELLLLFLIVLGPFARTVFTDNPLWKDQSYLSGMDGIAFGCLAAILSERYLLTQKLLSFFKWAGFLLVIGSFLFNGFIYRWGFGALGLNVTLLELGTAILLIYIYNRYKKSRRDVSAFFSPLCWYGRNSYEIYLTHLLVIIPLFGFFMGSNDLVAFSGFVVMSILSGVVGYFIAHFYSEPLNQKIRKMI